MNIALWILQGLLAFAFIAAGAIKLAKSQSVLAADPKMAWANDFGASLIKFIGSVEVLGGLGLVLPLALGILPILTPLAAAGLTIVMIGAIVTHIRRKEAPVPAVVLGILTALIAIGRFSI